MKYHVIFCPEHNLDIEVLYGEIGIEDLKEMVLEEMSHPLFRGDADVITDMRRARFTMSAREIEQWVETLASFDAIRLKKKVGYLTCSPNHVVASTLMQHSISDKRYPQSMKIFSTIDPMLMWLGKTLDAKEYGKIIGSPEMVGCEVIMK